MNNLAYTIVNNMFQYKTLVRKQYMNAFQWSNEETKGQVQCGTLLNNFSYSLIEFHAHDSLALNYHPKSTDGFIFVINRLSASNYVQLMMENKMTVDYSPRAVELYIIPANKLSSFTFAPGTMGKRVEIFVPSQTLNNFLSPALVSMLHSKPFLSYSELLNDTLYDELCKQADIFLDPAPDNVKAGVIFFLLSLVKNFNEFTEKTIITHPLFPYKNLISHDSSFKQSMKIA